MDKQKLIDYLKEELKTTDAEIYIEKAKTVAITGYENVSYMKELERQKVMITDMIKLFEKEF